MARATGIRRRHSRGCRSRDGGRCDCNAGWEAWVYLAREGKSVSKTFQREAEAKSWRADALAAAQRGAIRAVRRDTRTLAVALREFVEGMKAGTVRPKNRGRYKPNTCRSYEGALVNHIEPSGLGRLKVVDVRRADVQSLADELLACELAPGSVSNVLNPIQALYRRLMDRDLIAHNPADANRPSGPGQRAAETDRLSRRGRSTDRAPSRGGAAPVGGGLLRGAAPGGAAGAPGLRRRLGRQPDPCRVRLGPGGGGDRAEVRGEPADDPAARCSARPPGRAPAPHGPDGGELVFGRTAVDPFVPSSPRQPRPGVLGGGGPRAHHAA